MLQPDNVVQWPAPPLKSAWADIAGGISSVTVWGILGWQDIKQRYRRSVLGPFWLTISTAIMVSSMAFVYARLFHQPLNQYLPYVAAGMIVWNLISSIINESCAVFVAAEGIIKQGRLSLTVHVCKMVWRNHIIFFHNALILGVIYLIYGAGLKWKLLQIPLALLVIAANGIGLGIVLGIFCTRFRDVTPIVANVLQVVFFISPIMWRRNVLGGDHGWMADYNPFFHVIELIRAPFLGEPFPAFSWIVATSIGALALLAAFLTLARFRHRVAYWL